MADEIDSLRIRGDVIDFDTFEQILEMDEEGDREFSQQLVFDFFQQAETTMEDLDKNIESKKLDQLSALGHFLKGSSATLGLYKVSASCEKIQHWGSLKDETGNESIDDQALCLERIKDIMPMLKADYRDVKLVLVEFYGKSD